MATVATSIDALTTRYVEQLAERTPGSHALRAEAEQVLAGGVSSHFKAWQPFYVREAKGAHLTDVEADLLPKLPQAAALWKINQRSFLVDHTVLKDGHEWHLIQTDSRMGTPDKNTNHPEQQLDLDDQATSEGAA